MTLNEIMKPGYRRSVVCDSPAAPVSGSAVRCGMLTGVALTDESKEGNDPGYTSVDFGPRADMFPVTASAGAIAKHDAIFLADGAPTVLSNNSTGYFFGFAMAAIASGTATIEVQHIPSPGAGTLGAGTVGTTNLAASAVIESKLVPGAAGAGITGLVVKFVPDANVIGGIPVVHTIAVADGTGNTDVVFTHKTKILRMWFKNKGIAAHATADTLRPINGTGTNYIAAATAKTDVVNAVINIATLIEAYDTIAAGGTIRIAAVKDTNSAAEVYVLGVRVA